jgi:hypothetical protein
MEGLSDQRPQLVQADDTRNGRVHPRFLIHVLPKGFHRIRHYGLLAKASCADTAKLALRMISGRSKATSPMFKPLVLSRVTARRFRQLSGRLVGGLLR